MVQVALTYIKDHVIMKRIKCTA